ncbi:MAG: ABC transporter ATP-binding protein [Gemmatimonadetes bacterium]|nr:ABC transporter ATP-binding protein [Gemmatimonadota bacterium]NNK63275.1 ABC transporter ATP-binding protein [Gemmatimonadota bacterium]
MAGGQPRRSARLRGLPRRRRRLRAESGPYRSDSRRAPGPRTSRGRFHPGGNARGARDRLRGGGGGLNAPAGAPPPRVSIRGLSKRFGTVVALDDARLDAWPGEVHAVLGENGAGKTTLLSALAGLVPPDDGEIRIDGAPERFASPRAAWQRGIGMVHQHFALVDRMSVLENLALGRRRSGGFRLALGEVRRAAEELGGRVGLSVPLDATVESLGVGDRQRAEILKVLLRDPGVLVLDEPTAVLAPAEVEGLLELLRRLAGEGRAVLLVAHKLDEVLAVADRVTVLRRGRTVLEAARSEVDADRLAVAMVGSAPAPPTTRGPVSDRHPVIARLRGAHVDAADGRDRLDDVDLDIRAGEIVGVAGVEGNGQRELAFLLSGRRLPERGEVALPEAIAFIPQDRRREGLVLPFSVAENLALGMHEDPEVRRGPLLRWPRIRERAQAAIDRFAIRVPDPRTPVATLSGGNQQRVVVARELSGRPRLIVAENPTRGLDVAGAAFVHRTLRECASGDAASGVVVISTDLDEILALADRVVVLVRGRLMPVPESERSRTGIGARMLEGVS